MLKKLKLKNPEQIFQTFINWFNTRRKIAFFSTFIICLIIHFKIYFLGLTNFDGTTNFIYYFDYDWELSLGRWGLLIIDTLRYFLIFPFISTIISFVFLSFASIILVDLLDIKKTFLIFLVSICLPISPAYSSILMFFYCSDAYGLSIFLAMLAVKYIYSRNHNKKKNFILGILCITFSISLYQEYLSIIITLCVIIPILNILKNKKLIKDIFKDILYSVLVAILGVALYYTITVILLNVFNIEFTSYFGAKDISVLNNLKAMFNVFPKMYYSFYEYHFSNTIIENNFWERGYLNAFLFLMIFISVFLIIRNKKIAKLRIVFALVLIALLPIAINFTNLVAPELELSSMYIRLTFPTILIIPFLLALIQLLPNLSFQNIIKWCSLICCIIILFTYIISNILIYNLMENIFNEYYSVIVRVLDRIETNKNYTKDMKILITGIIDDNNLFKIPEYSIFADYTYCFYSLNLFLDGYNEIPQTFGNFIHKYCGQNLNFLYDKKTYTEIIESNEFKEMGIFPEQDAVKVINNVMVIKFTDTPLVLDTE